MTGDLGQLAFDLSLPSRYAREDLLVGAANRKAVELLDAWPNWPGNLVVLSGPAGSGKTHLTHMWSAMADAEIVPAANLAAETLAAVDGYNVAVENVDTADLDEEALFHLLNQVRLSGAYCMMTARSPPAAWPVQLPDLASRVRAAASVELTEPDDQLLGLVLHKLCADRQIVLSQGTADYLVARMERSLEAANLLVKLIDGLSLSQARPVTKPLAAKALSLMGPAHRPNYAGTGNLT